MCVCERECSCACVYVQVHECTCLHRYECVHVGVGGVQQSVLLSYFLQHVLQFSCFPSNLHLK